MIAAALMASPAVAAETPIARFVVPPAAAEELDPLLKRVVESLRLADPFDPEDDERLLRRLRDAATETLATEGYFSAKVTAERDSEKQARYTLRVDPGPRATVVAVDIRLEGGIEAQPARMQEVRAAWDLAVGQPFREGAWSTAKTRLLARVGEHDFAAARLVDSNAEVDVESATVKLRVEINSGPAFTLGELSIKGLERFDANLVERFNPFSYGDRYDAGKMLEFRRRLQASPYFGRVAVDIDTDTDNPRAVPIKVELTEAKTRRLSFALGYSTDVGPRFEATYRQSLTFGYPYTVQTGVGADKTRQVVYADLLLPPKPNGAMDSLGVLAEHTDIQEVITNRRAAGVVRANKRETPDAAYETRITFNLQREDRRVSDNSVAPVTNVVLSGVYSWTRRTVDSITDPHHGDVLTLRGGPGLSKSGIADSFVYTYGRYVRYFELSRTNQLILRGEFGHTFADDINKVPNDFLFRAGGAGSVRGYAYQSLGAKSGSAVLGSRSLITFSSEYVHWFNKDWGGALFYDVGDADDDIWHVKWAKGYGAGARWKTLAGPFGLDVAYGQQDHKWRVHFAISIAF
ncbi:MAG TPA: BamA/TamA family outer membrane protein [Burkholderiaceae bacterium]|nr:BamA/TamA family outer membrane protein [Burkholderiaceae bacterium]